MFDAETIADEIAALVQASLNTRVTAMNTEKNDGFVLLPISNDAYIFQDMNGVTQNYNPTLFYGIVGIEGVGQPGATPSKLQFLVAVILTDEAEYVTPARLLFRYQRILREIFEENFQLEESGCKLSVESQVPVEVTLVNSSHRHRAAAVLVTTDFA